VLEELPGKSGAKVTFNLDRSSFHEIDHLTDMSDEHIQSVWYSHEDYKEIKHSIKPIVREMMTYNGVIPEESDEFSSRGLGTTSFSKCSSSTELLIPAFTDIVFFRSFLIHKNVAQNSDHVPKQGQE
jgi:hypothetical protein